MSREDFATRVLGQDMPPGPYFEILGGDGEEDDVFDDVVGADVAAAESARSPADAAASRPLNKALLDELRKLWSEDERYRFDESDVDGADAPTSDSVENASELLDDDGGQDGSEAAVLEVESNSSDEGEVVLEDLDADDGSDFEVQALLPVTPASTEHVRVYDRPRAVSSPTVQPLFASAPQAQRPRALWTYPGPSVKSASPPTLPVPGSVSTEALSDSGGPVHARWLSSSMRTMSDPTLASVADDDPLDARRQWTREIYRAPEVIRHLSPAGSRRQPPPPPPTAEP